MSNFGEDFPPEEEEDNKKKKSGFFGRKKRKKKKKDKTAEVSDTSAESSASDPATPDAPEESAPSTGRFGFLQKKWVRIPLRAGTGLFILCACVAIYWSRMPRPFDVMQEARKMATLEHGIEPDAPLPRGYVTVSTVITLGDVLLEKPGGYMTNDRISVALFVDNIRNWEYGVVQQMRDTVQALRNEFSRARAQSLERPELIEAEGAFNFDHNSWVLPKTEARYRNGLEFVGDYLDVIVSGDASSQPFVARQDVLDGYMARQQKRLGSFTVRLQRNVAVYPFDPTVQTSTELEQASERTLNSWTKRDDEFYQIRGSVYVMYHFMRALREDYETVLNEGNAYGTMNRILSELKMASAPIHSPMLLHGEEFGMLQNHSLAMSAHLAKAHLAMQDLRQLLQGGSGM